MGANLAENKDATGNELIDRWFGSLVNGSGEQNFKKIISDFVFYSKSYKFAVSKP